VSGEDHGSDELLALARLYHDLAVALDGLGWRGLAETLHREAGIRMTAIPLGSPCDRDRVRWAVSLAENLVSQKRAGEARGVLIAALALADACFGHDDTDVLALRRHVEGPQNA
jgi:hypothetical protein